LKFSTTRTTTCLCIKTSKVKQNQFSIFLNTVISETTRSCLISNLILCSRLLTIFQARKTLILDSRIITYQTSSSCVSKKICSISFVIYSHRLQIILKEEHLKGERDSCSRRTLIHRELKEREWKLTMIKVSRIRPH